MCQYCKDSLEVIDAQAARIKVLELKLDAAHSMAKVIDNARLVAVGSIQKLENQLRISDMAGQQLGRMVREQTEGRKHYWEAYKVCREGLEKVISHVANTRDYPETEPSYRYAVEAVGKLEALDTDYQAGQKAIADEFIGAKLDVFNLQQNVEGLRTAVKVSAGIIQDFLKAYQEAVGINTLDRGIVMADLFKEPVALAKMLVEPLEGGQPCET